MDEPALSIAVNATPSIRELSLLREYTRKLSSTVRPSLSAAGTRQRDGQQFDAATSKRVRQILKDIKQVSTQYEALPMYPGELELWATGKQRIARVKTAADDLLTPVAANGSDGNTKPEHLFVAVDESMTSIDDLIEINAASASKLARDIRRIRQSFGELFLVFSVSGIAVSVLAATLSIRAIQSRARLAEEHWKLIEQRSQELEQFSDRVAHDILSPLGGVALGIETALRPDVSTEMARGLLERSKKGLQRVKLLVDDLLEFARSGAQPTPNVSSSVRKVLRDVHESFQPVAGQGSIALTIETAVSEDLAVKCAPGLLTSLLSNLVQNAIKYMGESKVRRVSIRAIQQNEEVRFEVEDTGPGIPGGLDEKIFRPYVRGPSENQSGLGLGLAIVRRLVESHSGTLGVDTKHGNGSRFWFTLPKAASTGQDRRGAHRIETTLVASYGSALANFDSRTENISIGGIKISAPYSLPVGSTGRVALVLDDGKRIESKVVVRYSTEVAAGLEFFRADSDFEAQMRNVTLGE
jgi:signal transduction histidine kinase